MEMFSPAMHDLFWGKAFDVRSPQGTSIRPVPCIKAIHNLVFMYSGSLCDALTHPRFFIEAFVIASRLVVFENNTSHSFLLDQKFDLFSFQRVSIGSGALKRR